MSDLRKELETLKKMAGNPNLLGLEGKDADDPGEDDYATGWDEDEQTPAQDEGKTDQEIGDKQKLTKDSSKKGEAAMKDMDMTAALEKKAEVCIKVSKLMVPNGNDEAIHNMSVDLMHMPVPQLARVAGRLVASKKALKIVAGKKVEEKLAAKKVEEKKAAEIEELDSVSAILKAADEDEVPTDIGQDLVEEDTNVEVTDEVGPEAEVKEETSGEKIDDLAEVSALLDVESSKPAAKQAAQKLEKVKLASKTKMSEDEIIQLALTDSEDVDVSSYFTK